MEFNLFTERSSAFITCSKCGSTGRVSRMKINSDFEKFLYRILKLRKYHCNDCKHDKIFFNYKVRRNVAKVLTNYFIFIIALTLVTIISYNIVKRYF
jgi:hypothetical protein